MGWWTVQRDFRVLKVGERWLIGRFSIAELISLALMFVAVGLVIVS
jgi:hypothetical protein